MVGVARRPWDDAAFHDVLSETVDVDALCETDDHRASWDQFLGDICYQQTHLDHVDQYRALALRLHELAGKACHRVFYLAIKPDLFLQTVEGLKEAGLLDETDELTSRVVVEKPFGHDLPSAQALNKSLLSLLSEKQLYRIDHYLGKETVQNILAFRFR